jgi:hypothetical protein
VSGASRRAMVWGADVVRSAGRGADCGRECGVQGEWYESQGDGAGVGDVWGADVVWRAGRGADCGRE